MIQMNLPIKQKQTQGHREDTCRGQAGWGGEGWNERLGLADTGCCMGCINSKVLLYHRELYPVRSHNGKEGVNECIFMHN